jgi:hypothetical protein
MWNAAHTSRFFKNRLRRAYIRPYSDWLTILDQVAWDEMGFCSTLNKNLESSQIGLVRGKIHVHLVEEDHYIGVNFTGVFIGF